jgi:uncharacterized membrane protein AbrB (regulator of aidB expression)
VSFPPPPRPRRESSALRRARIWIADGGSGVAPLSAGVSATPIVLADLAFAFIGLDVGLRFTRESLREAGELLPRAILVIVAMLIASAGFGVGLAASTHVSMLDGYLATTPGGSQPSLRSQ